MVIKVRKKLFNLDVASIRQLKYKHYDQFILISIDYTNVKGKFCKELNVLDYSIYDLLLFERVMLDSHNFHTRIYTHMYQVTCTNRIVLSFLILVYTPYK